METLELTAIRADSRTQIRVGIDEAVVNDYMAALLNKEELPAVTVFRDKKKRYWLADGFHRFNAYYQASRKVIPVEIREGELRDAVLYSLGANSKHGLRRSRDDKRKAVTTMLEDPEWREYSAAWIAEICGVTHTFVNEVTADWSGCHNCTLSDTVLAKDGKRYPRQLPKPKAAKPTAKADQSGPITSEQVEKLNDLFADKDDATIDGWLSPYGVEDWADLDSRQAAELLRKLKREQDVSPAAIEPPPATTKAVEAKPVEQPAPGDGVSITIGKQTIRLGGDLAKKWAKFAEHLEVINRCERELSRTIHEIAESDMRVLAKAILTKKKDRWKYADMKSVFLTLRDHLPAAPCPHCVSEPQEDCKLCEGCRFVSLFAWNGLVLASEKKALFKELGGA